MSTAPFAHIGASLGAALRSLDDGSDAASTTPSHQAHGLSKLSGRKAPAKVIAVASGKGGVGKTFVSTNLAVLSARRGLRVLLIDGDMALANADIALSAKPTYTIEHVLTGKCSLEEALTEAHGVFLLAASSGVKELSQLDEHARTRFLDDLTTLQASFDLVIVDCGAGIGDTVLLMGTAATSRVLVLTPEPTSLVDAYATAKALSEAGVDSLGVVVNCATSDAEARSTFGRLLAVVNRFLPVRLSYLGGIWRDDAVRKAVMARRPLVDLMPGSRASDTLLALERSLLERCPVEPLQGRFATWWDRASM